MNVSDRQELEGIRRRFERFQRMRLVDQDPERQRRHEDALQRWQRRYAQRRAELA